MFETLDIFRMSHAMATHAGRRQALVAQNVANSDTPGYAAKRLASFADTVRDTGGPQTVQKATRPGHLNGAQGTMPAAQITSDRTDPSPDGNTVSVEREMLESVNIKREHDRALTIYKSALTILRTSLGRG